jgi:hypothetical protein
VRWRGGAEDGGSARWRSDEGRRCSDEGRAFCRDAKRNVLIPLARNAGGWMGCGQAEAGTRPVVLPAERGAEPGGVHCPYGFFRVETRYVVLPVVRASAPPPPCIRLPRPVRPHLPAPSILPSFSLCVIVSPRPHTASYVVCSTPPAPPFFHL